ncbi:MAG: cobalamin-dependent protein [Thermoanaerobaculia bacterium]
MRVLFVYFNPTRDAAPAAPIGLAYVASAAADAGHDVRVADLIFARAPERALERAIADFEPEVIAFSIRNIDNVMMQRSEAQLEGSARLVRLARRRSAATIVVGGPAVTILEHRALERIEADYAIAGEGEEAFTAVLERIAAKRAPQSVAGVTGRSGGPLAPPRHLAAFGPSGLERWVDWRPYERRGATWPLQTKRGCPLHCTYCTYPLLEGSVPRMRDPEDVVDEIVRVKATAGPRAFEFVDATFNVPVAHAAGLCEAIAASGINVSFSTMGYNPLGSSPELLRSMRSAGFNAIMVTPESASEAMLSKYEKGFSLDAVEHCADHVERSGMASAWFFMLGGPGETKETVDETLRFVERRLRWRDCLVVLATGIRIFPGSTLARIAAAEGRVEGSDLADPLFYLSTDVEETWVLRRINQTIAACPNAVHSVEDGHNMVQRVTGRALHAARVAPPYWRFMPRILTSPPLRWLRARHPAIGESA